MKNKTPRFAKGFKVILGNRRVQASALKGDRPQRKACRADCAIRTAEVSFIN
jgi:hypothetical protein